MALEATFRHGEPLMVDYTPSAGNLAAGQVVLIGNTAGLCCAVTHEPIENNVQGALSVSGGVYEAINLNNAADGAKVYWDDSVNKLTTVSTNMAMFGFIVPGWGGKGANSTTRAILEPFV